MKNKYKKYCELSNQKTMDFKEFHIRHFGLEDLDKYLDLYKTHEVFLQEKRINFEDFLEFDIRNFDRRLNFFKKHETFFCEEKLYFEHFIQFNIKKFDKILKLYKKHKRYLNWKQLYLEHFLFITQICFQDFFNL